MLSDIHTLSSELFAVCFEVNITDVQVVIIDVISANGSAQYQTGR